MDPLKHTFGPVPSRRLGQSLGIDPIPSKTCNWNCAYCQLGRSIPLCHERREYFPLQEILADLDQSLEKHAAAAIDWITIVGSGEPTLYEPLDQLVGGIRTRSNLPLAVITNGSMLYLPAVREALLQTDLVMPSLDAGTAGLYKRLNRPHPQATFARLMEGMVHFRRDYTGEIWLEVMLVAGCNDTESALQEIAARIHEIRPDKVHLNLPVRPPAEEWVTSPGPESVERAMRILGNAAVIVPPAAGEFSLDAEDLIETLLTIVMRHPMSEIELVQTLRNRGLEPEKILPQLEKNPRLQVVERNGQRFWTAGTAHFPEPKP